MKAKSITLLIIISSTNHEHKMNAISTKLNWNEVKTKQSLSTITKQNYMQYMQNWEIVNQSNNQIQKMK